MDGSKYKSKVAELDTAANGRSAVAPIVGESEAVHSWTGILGLKQRQASVGMMPAPRQFRA